MDDRLTRILTEAKEQIKKAASVSDTEEIRVRVLGKQGQLTEILRSMGKLSHEEKKALGQDANSVKVEIEKLLEEKFEAVKGSALEEQFRTEKIDVTEPGIARTLGVKHPITLTINEISAIFMSMGFSIAEGPEVDTVFNNFDALNAPQNHPSRDMSDTFYITENTLLRTHTSPVQVRTLMNQPLPIKVVVPGRCFRCDTPDATHSPMFHQVEGLLVDEGVTMADLKGTLDCFAKRIFGADVRTKFRPHYFPFTEPSAEVDVSCFKCGGIGCRMCKWSGWIEIMGCGMVHPNVLRAGGIDPEVYSGFAFGVGLERMTMRRYAINDLRLFFENDLRFLGQF